jgi:cell division protein FtsQ
MTNWKKVLNITGWIAMAGSVILCIGFVNIQQENLTCAEIKIMINDEDGHYFVEEEDIRTLLVDKGKDVRGVKLSAINIGLLEKIIKNNSFVANAEVFSTIDGKVNIAIDQRRPLVRIINNADEQYYIDSEGKYMPLSDKYTARVVVANGHIINRFGEREVITKENCDDCFASQTLSAEIYKVALFIDNDPFWKSFVEQIYVTNEMELELIPKVGDYRILIGDSSDLDVKLRKLLIFYKKALSRVGWDKYSVINLKFKDQVVCTRK